LKHDREVVAAFEEFFKPVEGQDATKEAVDAACKAVFEEAALQFGPQGIYVRGVLNADMQGVSFYYKRPTIGHRVGHFIPCQVHVPEDNAEASLESNDENTTSNDEDVPPGSSQDRGALLMTIASGLDEDQYTKSGRPEVSAINEALGDSGVRLFTADERDNLWK